MAGIGDESFHLRRGLLLLVEALLYSGEHGVERDRQRTDLRVLRRRGTRCVRSPAAIFAAVFSMRFSGDSVSLGHQRGRRRAEYDDGHADDRCRTGQCLYGVKLVAQRQTDVAYAAGLAVLIGPRQRHDAPRRLGGGQRGMVPLCPLNVTTALVVNGCWSYASAAAVHRQQRHRTDAVLESGDDPALRRWYRRCRGSARSSCTAGCCWSSPVSLLSDGIDVVEDQLRLTEQLRIRLLQQIIADQRT